MSAEFKTVKPDNIKIIKTWNKVFFLKVLHLNYTHKRNVTFYNNSYVYLQNYNTN